MARIQSRPESGPVQAFRTIRGIRTTKDANWTPSTFSLLRSPPDRIGIYSPSFSLEVLALLSKRRARRLAISSTKPASTDL